MVKVPFHFSDLPQKAARPSPMSWLGRAFVIPLRVLTLPMSRRYRERHHNLLAVYTGYRGRYQDLLVFAQVTVKGIKTSGHFTQVTEEGIKTSWHFPQVTVKGITTCWYLRK